MTPPRFAFTGDRTGWQLTYGGVVLLSASQLSSVTQKRAVGDATARLVAELDDVIADRDEAERVADLLTAWAAKIEGRTVA